jgi:hypothetical protein
VRHSGIERHECLGLLSSFVFAAADNAWSFEVKLGQIGTGFPIVWI